MLNFISRHFISLIKCFLFISNPFPQLSEQWIRILGAGPRHPYLDSRLGSFYLRWEISFSNTKTQQPLDFKGKSHYSNLLSKLNNRFSQPPKQSNKTNNWQAPRLELNDMTNRARFSLQLLLNLFKGFLLLLSILCTKVNSSSC